VEVIVDEQGTGPRKVVELGKGEFFGDRALLTGEPRNATVVAIEPLEVYIIGRETFQRAREESVPFIETVLDVYGRHRSLLRRPTPAPDGGASEGTADPKATPQ
jgi:putative ABC transport system ATP-binding protein